MSGVNTVVALDPVWLRLIRLETSYSHKRRILVRYLSMRVCDLFRKMFEALLLSAGGTPVREAGYNRHWTITTQ
jgi:hypothetical protein